MLKDLLRFFRREIYRTFPRKPVLFLFFLFGLLKVPRKSYSQKGEDLLIDHYFGLIGVNKGIYCDIGCFHPVWISNTHLLDKRGWRGFAIDLDEFKLTAMKLWRKDRVQCILGAVRGEAAEGEIASVFKFRYGCWSDIDTLDRATAESYRDGGAGDFDAHPVQLLDVNRLFASLPPINFLNIDIEGLDLEVIQALDLTKYRPQAILFEDNEHWGGNDLIRTKLHQAGYERLFVSNGSVCFVLPAVKADTPSGWATVPQKQT
jgi:hypothetical protein